MLPEPLKSRPENRRLESWKEIATYLNRDERTAKRWEKVRALPVHRFPGVRSGVFAFTAEIDTWLALGLPAPDTDIVVATEPLVETPQPSAGRRLFPFFLTPVSATAIVLIAVAAFGGLLFSVHARNRDAQLAPHAAANSTPAKSPSAIAHVPPRDAEDLYLSGRYFWNKRTPADLNAALGLFKQAIQRDPRYAQAYIGLADTYSLLIEYGGLAASDAFPPAIAAAKQAIALNPSLPEAHRSLAFTSYYWSWDRSLSEQEFRKAILLDPHDATTHHWFANTLMSSARYADAEAEIEAARQLDPTSFSTLADRQHIFSCTESNEENIRGLTQIESIDPNFIPVHRYLVVAWREAGSDRNYLEELKQMARLTHRPADAEILASATRGFATAGHGGITQAIAETQLSLYRRGLTSAFDVSEALANAGRKAEAMRYLRLSYHNRDTQFLTLQGRHTLPSLQDDPEFQRLAEHLDHPYDAQTDVADLVLPSAQQP